LVRQRENMPTISSRHCIIEHFYLTFIYSIPDPQRHWSITFNAPSGSETDPCSSVAHVDFSAQYAASEYITNNVTFHIYSYLQTKGIKSLQGPPHHKKLRWPMPLFSLRSTCQNEQPIEPNVWQARTKPCTCLQLQASPRPPLARSETRARQRLACR
jgi:hypothetical protein